MAYHAGLPAPGGFVGVDVFFVISGFVITGMIEREHEATGQFRLGRFYLRRFKRLAPALALVVTVTIIVSFCLLSPFVTQQLAAKTGLGAILLCANWVIARTTGNYFLIRADWNPLVHTWSLSVEEQIYLFFPAILLLCWKLSRRVKTRIPWAPVVIGSLTLISLGLMLPTAFGEANPDLLGFYSPITRACEFGAGALLALATSNWSLPSRKTAALCAWSGVAILVGAVWLIDKTTPYPGSWTLLPMIGTVLVIGAGTMQGNQVARALSLPAMVALGDWSYSLYLWHWPIRVFAVHLWPDVSFVPVLAIALSILPAVVTYRTLEQPVRRMPQLTRRPTVALIGVFMLPPLVVASVGIYGANHYWLPRYKSGAIGIVHPGDSDWNEYFSYLDTKYYPCTDQTIRRESLKWESGITRCRQSQPSSRIDIALVGDSHAEHLFLGLAEAAPEKNIVYYVVTNQPVRSDPRTNHILDHVASDPAIKTVIVNSNWPLRGVPGEELVTTLSELTSRGKTAFVTDDIPLFWFDAEACKYRISPVVPYTKCSVNRRQFQEVYDKYYPVLRDAVHRVPGVQMLNTAEYFCDTSMCSMTKGDILYYRDLNHVNDIGSRFLAHRMLANYPEFRAQFTGPASTTPNRP
ncbi:acyltransferase family protein [Mycobacterium kubicae]|uniref:acyltransferase family protein n=1 Tax=Mycobacterium kubicae TaxID=120959 RepID=UPI001FD0F236|nr:acyltransferase family protein [Mycobacterium kubicae]